MTRLFIDAKFTLERVLFVLLLASQALTSSSCNKPPDIPKHTVIGQECSNPRAFKLYVSNQSTSLKYVDIMVQIDGVLIVNQYFHVGSQHNWKLFEFKLCHGKHTLFAKTKKGEVELKKDFQISESVDYGVLNYWFYDKNSDADPMPRSFIFGVNQGEFGPA